MITSRITPAATPRRTISVCWSREAGGAAPVLCCERGRAGRAGSSPSSKNDKVSLLGKQAGGKYDHRPASVSWCSPPAAGSLPAAQNQQVTVDRTTPTLAAADSLPTAVRPRAGPAARVLDRYDLERRLGAGAYGAVWLGRDTRLERDVAVKVVPRGDGPPRAEREALAAARLNHPGIVSLYEAGADETAHYLVSELVDGVTLAEAEARGALSDRDVLRIGAALCEALEHAHAAGVVHRDIKPGNVIIPARPASEAGVAKLTDFGVAHLAGEDALTHTGDIVGTLAYMAPEQAEGARVGPAADLYALALVLYEALAGVNPVRAAAPAATARRVAAGVPSLGRMR